MRWKGRRQSSNIEDRRGSSPGGFGGLGGFGSGGRGRGAGRDQEAEELLDEALTADQIQALEELRQHCEGALAGFKHPRRLALVDALPRTPATGQVQRRLLIERLSSAPGTS